VANRPQAQTGLNPRELQEIEGDQKRAVTVERLSFGELLKSHSFWLITAGMIVSTTTVFTLIQWIPSFLISQRQLPFEVMSRWITVGYVLATVIMILAGSIADRTMERARTAAWTGILIAVLVIPGALLLPATASAVFLAALIGGGAVSAALNGALMHAMVRPEAIARGTGIYTGVGTFISALGPAVFGRSIQALDGAYWGGFLFLAVANLAGATCYFSLQRVSLKARQAAAGLAPLPAAGGNSDGVPVPEP
jgi:ACS family D-galactonate transporter-like MFS transporter